MPWLPELFSAPVLERVLEERRRENLLAVPYFEGLLSGENRALIGSFAGEPELHHPGFGRVKGEAAFERFIAARTRGCATATSPSSTSTRW